MQRRHQKTPLGSRYVAPVGMGARHTAGAAPSPGGMPAGAAQPALQSGGMVPEHPLVDTAENEALRAYELRVKALIDSLVPVLKEISGLQREPDFVARAQALARDRLGFALPEPVLEDAWITQLNMRALYAYGMFQLFGQMVDEYWHGHQDLAAEQTEAMRYFLDCDFHEVDISPCSDGRLMGLIRFVLRMPHLGVRVRSYAGAMFDIEEDVRHWTRRELIRFREGVPTTPDAPTRYLKVAAYHYSSVDPSHEGCAAHGSNEKEAAEAALLKLRAFRQSIENSFCCGASVDTLLLGVDTDTDSIKVHVPDGDTHMSIYRYVDSADLYRETAGMDRNQAAQRVDAAIQEAVESGPWGQGNGAPHDGMRRLVQQLLLNNLSQIHYVKQYHDGHYEDVGHQERFIVVGDGCDELQVRNLAYFANLYTVEEGAQDLDVGVHKIFHKLNVAHGLPIPVIVHYRYDADVPGSRDRVIERCKRVKAAIMNRYRDLADKGLLYCNMLIRDHTTGSRLEPVEV